MLARDQRFKVITSKDNLRFLASGVRNGPNPCFFATMPFRILFPAFCDAGREPGPEFHRQK